MPHDETDQVDFIWIDFKMNQKRRKDAYTLDDSENLRVKMSKDLAVCSGGTLECPPGVVTSKRMFIEPFSATPGLAKTVPYASVNPPAGS